MNPRQPHPRAHSRRGRDEPRPRAKGSADAAEDAVSWAAQLAGDRWVLILTNQLDSGPRTFSELASTGAAPNILTERLRRMTAAGLIVATPYSLRPLRLRYQLTGPGHELAHVVRTLRAWGARHSGAEPLPTHAVCGTPLEPTLWCPTCAQAVGLSGSPDDDDELYRL